MPGTMNAGTANSGARLCKGGINFELRIQTKIADPDGYKRAVPDGFRDAADLGKAKQRNQKSSMKTAFQRWQQCFCY